MVSVKTCLEAIMKEVGEVKRALADTHEEFHSESGRATRISDPYPRMAEKAGRARSPALGKLLRFSSIGGSIEMVFFSFY